MSFLTIEDINGTIFSNQGFYWKEIDTSNISTTEDYSNVPYDFVKVTRETGSNTYDYTFDIQSANWTKGYYILDNNGNLLTNTGTLTDDELTFSINKTSIRLFLYMGISSYNTLTAFTSILKNEKVLLDYKAFQQQSLNTTIINLSNNTESTVAVSFSNVGYVNVTSNSVNCGYLLIKSVKSDFQFNCTQTLTIGKVNKVQLGTTNDYKPNGDYIGNYAPNITVEYKGETLPVTWDSTLNDYVFDLDLTEKTNISKIRFKVNVDSNTVINASETIVSLLTQYETASSYADLLTACDTGGNHIIQLGGDITFTANIPVKHDIKIIGNNATLDLDEHSIILDEGIEFNCENVSFDRGDTTIMQGDNSIVSLTNCNFTNCTSSNYNGLGSCIFCDNDLENLDNPTDYETILNNCTFTDNQSCIFHSGILTVNNCSLHNTDKDYADPNNVAFVYQVDGVANITQSIFDIDYDTDYFCTNETNLGFAQAIILCGETANINGATYIDLQANNTLPFFNQENTNQSHIFAKYYYPQAETCVYISPLTSMENRCCCHAVSGVDWIFKNNAEITRASWDTQNENRLITWED